MAKTKLLTVGGLDQEAYNRYLNYALGYLEYGFWVRSHFYSLMLLDYLSYTEYVESCYWSVGAQDRRDNMLLLVAAAEDLLEVPHPQTELFN